METRCEHDYGWWSYTEWCEDVHSSMASFSCDNKIEEGAREPFDYSTKLHILTTWIEQHDRLIPRKSDTLFSSSQCQHVEDSIRGSCQLLEGKPARDGRRNELVEIGYHHSCAALQLSEHRMQASSVELVHSTTTSAGSDLECRRVYAFGYSVRGSLVTMSFAGASRSCRSDRGEYFYPGTCFAREVSPQPR
jgi:hypothetical protein